jgi:hypothetical protein
MATLEGKFNLLTDLLDVVGQDTGVERWSKLEGVLQLLTGPLCLSYKTYTADGVADMTKTLHLLGSGVDITGCDPLYVGQVIIIVCTDSTNNATADCTSATWDGTNDLATFPDTEDLLMCVAISTTRWMILANVTGVTFS